MTDRTTARGYFGIGVYEPKTETNIGTLWRTAHNFGAAFIFVIGARYRRQPSDTTNASLHVPLLQFSDWDDFRIHLPRDCEIICVENKCDARELKGMYHPQRAAYVLGAEDYGIPEELMRGHQTIVVEGARHCLNVAVAGSIVIYDRCVTKGAGDRL